MDKQISQKELIELIHNNFSTFIRVDGVGYKLDLEIPDRKVGDDVIIDVGYFIFDGETIDYSTPLLRRIYKICDALPEITQQKEGQLKDGTVYSLTVDNIITHFSQELSRFNYEPLEEILTRDAMFHRELASVINKYSKDNDINTPDYILATYLASCLETYNNAIKQREKHFGVGLDGSSKSNIKEEINSEN